MNRNDDEPSILTCRAADTHSKNALRAWLQLLKCSKRMEQIVNGKFNSAYGCSLTRFDVLANLDIAPEHAVTTTQLANLLIASKGNITRLLDRMEDDGLIRRQPNKTDRRISDIYLAQEGARLFEQMADDHETWISDIFNVLSNQETKQLVNILGKLRSWLEDAGKA